MRPDEHKKKKNAAYKKKHGITSDNKEEKAKPDKEKSTLGLRHESELKKSQAKTQLPATSDRAQKGAGAANVRKVVNISADSSSSDSEAAIFNKKKSYKRREIVSNWQKYELQPADEEKVSERGESYEKLLCMAGSEPISHFRFKDELSWEDAADPNVRSSDDTYSQFLSVNTAELSETLKCLPLHQVLGISKDIFPAEELSSIINKAKENNKDYVTRILGETKQASSHDNNVVMSENFICSSATPNKQLNLQSKLQLQSKATTSSITSLDQERSSTNSRNIPEVSVKKEMELKNSIGDSIAELSTKKPFHQDKPNILTNKSLEKHKLHDENLDTLLDIDNPTDKVMAENKEAATQMQMEIETSFVKDNITTKLATETDTLEAWLDSVLDD